MGGLSRCEGLSDMGLLTSEQAAEKLTIKGVTLRLWRKRGKGPAYIVMSRGIIRYRISDIESYLKANTHGGTQ